MKAKEATKPDRRLSARCAAVASLGAAVIHFAVAPMHWRDWLVSGVFFAGVAVFQLLWALLVWSRPGTGVLAAGFVANAGAAALWVVSRTVGVPFGPHGGQPEAVDGAGIAVLLLQCYVVMGAGWALLTRYRAEDVGGFGRALVLVGANAVMVGAVAVGLASGLQGHHHGDVAEAEGEHSAAHEAHAEGHHHDADHTDSVAPPKPAVPNPATSPVPADSGRPVTDMGLHTDDGHQHSTSLVAPDASVPLPSSVVVPQESGVPGTDAGEATGGGHHDHG